jgi:hypothetical protein
MTKIATSFYLIECQKHSDGEILFTGNICPVVFCVLKKMEKFFIPPNFDNCFKGLLGINLRLIMEKKRLVLTWVILTPSRPDTWFLFTVTVKHFLSITRGQIIGQNIYTPDCEFFFIKQGI